MSNEQAQGHLNWVVWKILQSRTHTLLGSAGGFLHSGLGGGQQPARTVGDLCSALATNRCYDNDRQRTGLLKASVTEQS